MGKYSSILNGIQKKAKPGLNEHILLVDSMNTFIRNFTMINLINPEGHHVVLMVPVVPPVENQSTQNIKQIVILTGLQTGISMMIRVKKEILWPIK